MAKYGNSPDDGFNLDFKYDINVFHSIQDELYSIRDLVI